MPKYTPRRGKSSDTPDQMETATVVDKDSLAMCVIELLKDETVLKRMKEVLSHMHICYFAPARFLDRPATIFF